MTCYLPCKSKKINYTTKRKICFSGILVFDIKIGALINESIEFEHIYKWL